MPKIIRYVGGGGIVFVWMYNVSKPIRYVYHLKYTLNKKFYLKLFSPSFLYLQLLLRESIKVGT